MTDAKKKSHVCASDRYNKKNYESVGLRVRKGTRERWRVFADSMGFSLAKLVVLAVDAYIISVDQQQQSDQRQPDQQQQLDQRQPDQQQQFFRHTSLSKIPFLSDSSLSALADIGIFTIDDYVSRYYDDDPDELLTVVEEDELDDLLFDNHLW